MPSALTGVTLKPIIFLATKRVYTKAMQGVLNSFSGVSVNDLAAARTFYVDTLGLKLVDEKMGLDLELPGGGRFFIYHKPNHTPATFTVLNFVVSDIDAAIDELTAKGVSMQRFDLGGDIKQDDKGVARGLSANMGPDIAWFSDPAGNILSVLQPE